MSEWSDDIDMAKGHVSDCGQILAEIRSGYYQVISWDDTTETWRENTNHLALRQRPLRWRSISD